MSIGPIESFPPPASTQSENVSVGVGTAPGHSVAATAQQTSQPVSGTLSKQEKSVAKNVPEAYEVPEDVVEVHQDPDIKNQVIIEYLDKAKDIVLQVPSTEELSVERGIAAEFQQAAKLRATEETAPASEGGKSHGNKL